MQGIKKNDLHDQNTYLRQNQSAWGFFLYLVDWKSNNLFDRNVNVHVCPLGIDEIFQVSIIFIGNSYDMKMRMEHLIFTWVGDNTVQGWRSPWITTGTCLRLLWSGQNDKMPCAGRPTDNLRPSAICFHFLCIADGMSKLEFG